MAMLVNNAAPHEDDVGCIYRRLSLMIQVLEIKLIHFMLGAGLRAGPNSNKLAQEGCLVSSN